MADYDVEALALVTPPRDAVLTSYRPAVSVRNNGNHEAIADGWLRIYSAGLVVFTTQLFSGTIAPGATGIAQGQDNWTPNTEGPFVIFGYLTCDNDQNEPNNNLAPSTIVVSGGPVPPPSPVTPHAPQHEEGGTDEISIDGLSGLTKDPQVARPHAATHQAAGNDQLNVSGLAGVLGEPQVPTQHGNEWHDPDFATASALAAHQAATSVHTSATNLANRETSGTLSGLVPGDQLTNGSDIGDAGDDPTKFALRNDRKLGPSVPVHHANKHAPTGDDPLNLSGLGFELSVHKNAANGYCPLDTNAKVPSLNLANSSSATPGSKYLTNAQTFDVPVPTGLICLWNGGSPIPTGWHQVTIIPAPPAPYIYINRDTTP